ncbi:class I SAM-dependent RNA methyltransferase [Spirochaeta cellobiosiphila]|uniref:class I SAM-dependent RNA methyltransferase n=1 Tax=Spirochaeta cellobiosiphila TaxID=504483 RepID=UPI0004098C50|nr:TRAM domain-containing protein [Spirochaeta cellobiosiphila]
MTVNIEKIINNGNGLGFVDGQAVFVPYSVPGDILEINIVEDKKNYMVGNIVKIVEPSKARIEAPCPYYMKCGGCNLQHIAPQKRIDFLKEMLIELYQRNGGFSPDIQWIEADTNWEYRNRVQLHSNKGHLGYMSGSSHTVIPIESCAVLIPVLNKLFKDSYQHVGRKNYFGIDNKVYQEEEKVNINILGKEIQFPNKGFFQSNITEITKVLKYIRSIAKGKTFYDLYGGVGTFSTVLEEQFNNFVVVESYKEIKAYANNNIKGSKKIFTTRIEHWLKKFNGAFGSDDWVMVDPPRTGLDKSVRKFFIEKKPANLIYLSCNPATHARDMAELLQNGYKLDVLQVYDFNPQTAHLECLSVLKRDETT